ncbi:MAG: cation transporter [Ardenticatenaceae bacterium]|nr:cation transporter [Ardenticatenaceae bacterium]
MAEKSSEKSPIVVYGAITANFIIAVSKFVAAVFTGSSAMLSEGIHSAADTGNQCLILLGLNRSKKPADEQHPFGHGQELYFWSLIVAIVLFGLGGGLSIYEGIVHIQHPGTLESPIWNYVVLGIAFVSEGTTWLLALREMLHQKKPDESFWQTLHRSKDPSIYTVLGEDTAALLGILVAFLGVFLGSRLQMPVLDGVASLIVGIILVIIAAFLAYESKGLIVGESTDMDVVKQVRQIAQSDPAVDEVNGILTMHFGPNDVLLNMDIGFRSNLPAAEVATAVDRLESNIREEAPLIKRIFIEAEALKQKSRKSAQDGSST